MKNFYKKIIIILFLAGIFFGMATVVLAQNTGLEETAGAAGLLDTGIDNLPQLIGTVIGAALALIGAVFLLLMLYGGFIWMLARGNDQEVTRAKNIIISAIYGIIIIVGAYAITYYVMQALGVSGS
ncbi:MAG: hypothetical protein Q8Q23_05105 [bacterium]|nr:hypothetical protein [bacterium]